MEKKELFCYCAFCRNPRRVFRKRGVGLFNVIQAFGIALIASYVFWQNISPKALVIFAVVLMLIEMLILLRARLEATCPHCGFDPILYARDKDAACRKAKAHIDLRQNDPDVWLARRPPLRFSKRKKKGSSREIVV